MKNSLIKIFIICLVINQFNFSQVKVSDFFESEREHFIRGMHLAEINYPGDFHIDITYYKLNLNITYSPQYLIGETTVKAVSKSDGLNSFFLDLNDNLTVDSVLSEGKWLLYNHSNSKLNISLNKNYNSGEEISLVVYYQGVPKSGGFGSFEFGEHNGKPSIWSLSEPYGASDWWPCKDTPADKADSSDVWITCDTSLTAVSNGSLVSTINNDNGTHTFKWKNHYPIAQYLISVAISDYYKYNEYFHYSPDDSLLVANYVYPEHFQDSKAAIDLSPDMLKIFSEKYGLYPFIKEKYAQVEFGWSGGMEHQTATSVVGPFGEEILVHEMAHQWFGDKVTCADWNDVWLNEGFATYSEAVYHEAKYGEKSYRDFIYMAMKNAKFAKGSIYLSDISSASTIFYSPLVYYKGAVVLHMLRGITGDSTFFKILRSYLTDPKLAYGTATTEDFEAAAEKVYGSSLEYFFNEWIYNSGYPTYNIYWKSTHSAGNKNKVSINISQQNASSSLFFTMPLKFKLYTSLGDTILTVFNNRNIQSFDFIIKGYADSLTFDPDNNVFKEFSIVDSTDRSILFSFALEQNFPNPFNSGTDIQYILPFNQEGAFHVKLEVYDILGRKITTLVDMTQSPGIYDVIFPDNKLRGKLASGIYIYSFSAGDFKEMRKMILLK